jgi:hypothetical protein
MPALAWTKPFQVYLQQQSQKSSIQRNCFALHKQNTNEAAQDATQTVQMLQASMVNQPFHILQCDKLVLVAAGKWKIRD